jgi:hypothetical protein
MDAMHTQSPKRRTVPTLVWAGGGTLLLHSVFLLALWLWPQSPPKPRETLLEVDLTDEKPQKVALLAKPTPIPKQKPVPVATPRMVKVKEVKPKVVLATPKPTTKPVATPPPPKPPKLLVRNIEKPNTTRPPQLTTSKTAPKAPLTSKPMASLPKPSGSPVRTSPIKNSNAGASAKADSNSAPAGGARRRLARNIEETEGSSIRSERPANSTAGSNSLGSKKNRLDDDAAQGERNIDLPRTRARRGRSGSQNTPLSSAPTSSLDGTEVNLSTSRPTSTGGGQRRASFDAGNGESDNGSINRRGLENAGGSGNSGNSRTGRGPDEAGLGVGNGASSGGTGNGSGRGRARSQLAGNPFGTGGTGNGVGNNNGDGKGNSNGTGKGPTGGLRLARRSLGVGASDGDGTGGTRRGIGLASGDGNGGTGTTGRGSGNGRGDENANGGSDTRNGSGRGRGGHRDVEGEDEIGRGIWGGFKIRYYQDKSDHPDLPDATFHPGNPIDWPVFSTLIGQKTVPNLDFNWGTTPPLAGMKHTFWSMKAAGRIFVPKDDTYEFFFDELDDAGSLMLNGKIIIKVWQVQKSSPSSGKMFLKRGPHDLQIEYVQGPATAASIKLSWRSTSFPKETVGVYQAP